MNLEEHQDASAPTQTLQPSQDSGHYPKEGEVISLHVNSQGEVAATVTGRSDEELSINLVRLASVPFKGDYIRKWRYCQDVSPLSYIIPFKKRATGSDQILG